MRSFFDDHRKTILIAGAAILCIVVFVLVWFQPQKLFVEQTVDEDIPVATTESVQPTHGQLPTGNAPETLVEGAFQSLEHDTTGTARIIELANGDLFLRFEDFETSNGPDLRVYLSEIPASDDWHAYGERFIDLGGLKGNRGNQNYEIPAGADLSKYRSAVIWCRRFTVGFGVAPLV